VSTIPASDALARRLAWLANAPFVAGAAVAVLYSLGAMVETARFRDAGVQPLDVLTLVPIQDALALGVATFFSFDTLYTAFVIWLMLYVILGAERWLPSKKPVKHPWRIIFGVLAATFVLLAFTVSAKEFYVFYFTVGSGISIWSWLIRRPYRWTVVIAVTGVACVLLETVLLANLYPLPLPTATIVSESGGSFKGPLIATTSDGWYVKVGKPARVVLVPTGDIRSAAYVSAKRAKTDGRSVAGYVREGAEDAWP
jgi:hypothetical protein